ncbi:MAG: hypothetical protein A2901_03395 [Elusimicrobia bacterium RIFCSPLOWO2_01_FULL_54_10]|nr:MAG: hypothetical protein A2901_03395 [Elusimicrobia bacterium RIFCSPLOWO2_01_FULL_54_10]
MQDDLDKLAVYCNPKNKTWVFSAVCSHLGRSVGWNNAEKSWDCPCHGSRFDCYGKMISR